MFYKIPVINGQPDIDHTTDFFEDSRIVDITGENGNISQIMYGKLMSGNKKETWTEITEEEFYKIATRPVMSESKISQELLNAEILLNQAEILAKQNEQDEVLAEILLNQMGV